MRKVTTTYFCDKCGKEITEPFVPVFMLKFAEYETGSIDEDTQDVYWEVCADCRKLIEQFIVQKPFQTPQKREFDVGKAQALRDAGWTYKAISEEMKCSEQTVWNKLNKKAGDKDAEDEA